jgi:hypothetical protein
VFLLHPVSYLLIVRDIRMCKQSKSNRKPSYILGTHFLGSLFVKTNAYSYANVQRWTKDVPIFNAKTVLIPHCEHLHWTLFHIDIELKEITSLDSAFMGSDEYCRIILRCAALFSSPSTSHERALAYYCCDVDHLWQMAR